MKQSQALDILKMGENVFLTGQAGSGKTYVLEKYVKHLKENGVSVAITASTGIAATHLNGTTIHSWSGIGIKDKLSEDAILKLIKKPYLRRHYLETSVLIIDEVSMLHAHQLDMVDYLAQIFRQSTAPFGGMQVVLAGDFFQLPPVAGGDQAKFVTESAFWKNNSLRVCYLDEQFRHNDNDLLNILNQIRSGQVEEDVIKKLNSRLNKEISSEIKPTKLFTHNADVDAINAIELAKIENQVHRYKMRGSGNKNVVEILQRSCLAPQELVLKIGAKVMFVKNDFENGVVNGTLGKIVGFDPENDYPEVEVRDGRILTVEPTSWMVAEDQKIIAQIDQFPLRLAWAITVHKSQGMSLDLAEMDLSNSFAYGMGYVALSRVRTLDGLKLLGFNQRALEVDPQIIPLDKKFQMMSDINVKMLERVANKKIEHKQNDFVEKNKVDPNSLGQAKKKTPNHYKTLKYIKKELSLEDIASQVGFTEGTVINHISRLIDEGEELDFSYMMPGDESFSEIEQAFEELGPDRLKPVYDYFGGKYDYDTLKLVRLKLIQ